MSEAQVHVFNQLEVSWKEAKFLIPIQLIPHNSIPAENS